MDALRFAAFFSVIAASVLSGAAETPVLPDKVRVPEVHAAPAGNIAPRRLGDTPVPEPRPQSQEGDAADGKQSVETPAVAPIPRDAPDRAGDIIRTASLPDPRSGQEPASTMPLAEIACRQRLQELGVVFENHAPEASEVGCAVPYPIVVRSLGGGVSVRPEAVMNCAMAESAARFTANVAAPAAKREFGLDLKAVDNASAYVCRPRNGSTKLSEHAFGNALDISRFELADGKAVDVILRPEEREARFLGALRKAACGPFKTVLGPGSNADHETHFHLDLAPRRNGGTVCE